MGTLFIGIVIGLALGKYLSDWVRKQEEETSRREEEASERRILALQEESIRRARESLDAEGGTKYKWNGKQVKIIKNGETFVVDPEVVDAAKELAASGKVDEAAIVLHRKLQFELGEATIIAEMLAKKLP